MRGIPLTRANVAPVDDADRPLVVTEDGALLTEREAEVIAQDKQAHPAAHRSVRSWCGWLNVERRRA